MKFDLLGRMSRVFSPSLAAADAADPGRASPDRATEELLVRLRRAEPSAIDAVYRAHQQVLRAFAQRLIGDQAAAEDLVQDVFVSLPGLVGRFRGQSSLRTFLLGVAAKRASRHLRSAVRRRAALTRLRAADVRAEGTSPEHEYLRAQGLQVLSAALDRLPFAQRTAFVLCEVEERSALEVAVILGVPEATVRTRCFHARKKLGRSLRGEVP